MSITIGAYNPLIGSSLVGGANAASSSTAANPFQAPDPTSAPVVDDASAAARDSGASKAVSDFLAYAKETPAQRMRDAILKSMGLTEDDLKSMSPDKRKAVEETIEKKIKDAAQQAAESGKKGFVTDVTA